MVSVLADQYVQLAVTASSILILWNSGYLDLKSQIRPAGSFFKLPEYSHHPPIPKTRTGTTGPAPGATRYTIVSKGCCSSSIAGA
jgi:hypothetical protein